MVMHVVVIGKCLRVWLVVSGSAFETATDVRQVIHKHSAFGSSQLHNTDPVSGIIAEHPIGRQSVRSMTLRAVRTGCRAVMPQICLSATATAAAAAVVRRSEQQHRRPCDN